MSSPLIVDIHTHVYPPAYIDMLRARHKRWRPADSSYSDIKVKLDFMEKQGIDCSMICLANPWLNFIGEGQASEWAQKINNDLESTCVQANSAQPDKLPHLFAFGALPLGAPQQVTVADEVHRVSTLPHIRGVIMGTTGQGNGLDDPELEAVWEPSKTPSSCSSCIRTMACRTRHSGDLRSFVATVRSPAGDTLSPHLH
ncbi:hypothetical protein N7499_004233 [Penicillium canescens]|uniref:Amidohydrolase-related domain-containing protein n=1 Tax=Penicillium canescens TaxID=5083 RepID=A0AAD6I9G5_PENCN|nr:uncharacterized protein N7446_005102 [Penicillium canescens]KAJ6038288.1 hypothetical protein N7460_008059 [Penicillium canescens]KAJ6039591.1 hypothetical protein N7444_008496 [Penicillium canescens]KAJ6068065.1 hypothetical protein N7446_005102 [Penicillium canescens]KAJ6088051.1 hypothetical protein N7499_004233 [Penicillium canescens]